MKNHTPYISQPEAIAPDCHTAAEWIKQKEQACAMLQQHTEDLRLLMAQMRLFNHLTPVEEVMQGQARSEALRRLIKVIERELQQLDKAYREAAQRELLRREMAQLTAV